MSNYIPAQLGSISNFRYWCQKVLPAVYDDSLSYYELLCKVVSKLNEVIDLSNHQTDVILELEQQFITLKTYVDEYFDNLDVQEEINNKLDAMAQDGSLTALLENILEISYPELRQVIDDYNDITYEKQHFYETDFIGRIYRPAYEGTTNPQGFCMLDNNVGLFSLTNSTDSNACKLLKIDLISGEIEESYDKNFGHCNDMAYNPDNNKIYVCPANDYSAADAAGVRVIYICDADTLDVEETLTFEFRPHAICYDRITHKMYIISVPYQGTEFTLHEFNPTTGLATEMFSYSINDLKDKFTFINRGTGGYQGMCAYDNIIYHIWGGNGVNYIVTISPEDGVEYINNIRCDAFIHALTEVEDMDFNEQGTAFIYSKSRVYGRNNYAAICAINVNATVEFTTVYNSRFAQTGQNCRINSSLGYNYNIKQFGSTEYPFTTFAEAMELSTNNTHRIYLTGDSIVEFDVLLNQNMIINLNNHKLTMDEDIAITNLGNLKLYGGKIICSNATYPFVNNGQINSETIDFDFSQRTTNKYLVHNYGIIFMMSCTHSNDTGMSGNSVACANVGLLVLYNTSITYGNVGTLAS